MKIDINQLEFIDRILRDIVMFVESFSGMEPTITSLYRINDNGVHGSLPLRGVDVRIRRIAIGHDIITAINDKWQYDDNRPTMKCAVLHGVGFNLHLHLQTHPNTKVKI